MFALSRLKPNLWKGIHRCLIVAVSVKTRRLWVLKKSYGSGNTIPGHHPSPLATKQTKKSGSFHSFPAWIFTNFLQTYFELCTHFCRICCDLIMIFLQDFYKVFLIFHKVLTNLWQSCIDLVMRTSFKPFKNVFMILVQFSCKKIYECIMNFFQTYHVS